MSTQVQRRRGTTAEHAAFTGALAEITIDTTKNTAVVHDGATAGGHPLSKASELIAHLTDAADAHAASAITNTPAGTIAATTVQAAIDELDGDIVAHLGDTTDAHDASAISVLDTSGRFTSTDVEGCLAEAYDNGLSYFSETRNTSAPNATIPAHQLIASGAEVSIDFVVSPKGSGAILAEIPDSLSLGGDKRGTSSVDFQISRTLSTEVASGAYSVICGGDRNTSSGSKSSILGGYNNNATGDYSSIPGGYVNTASGFCSSSSGIQNTSSGIASVTNGESNQAGGDYSTIPGGLYGTTRGLYGRYSYASGRFSTTGDAQEGDHVLRLSTTDATASILTADGSATPSTTNVSVLPNNHAYTAVAYISARDTSTGDFASWKIEGAVKRGANAAATALVGTPAITTIAQEAGASTWAVAMVANTTRGSVEIQVTGEAATTIHWVCKLVTVEVG